MMKVYFNFALSLIKNGIKDKAKAGRSSEQLIHIHIAKIAVCPCFSKF